MSCWRKLIDTPEPICKYRFYPCQFALSPQPVTTTKTCRKFSKRSAKIFAEKGFHHTSVRDISRATKMSLSGLYYYFTTKEELLYLIQERCFLTLLQRWEQATATDVDVRARIRAFAENHLSFFLHNMPEMKVMAHEDESLTGEFNEKILVLKRRYVKVIMDLDAGIAGTRRSQRHRFARGNVHTVRHDELDLYLVPAQARLGVASADRADVADLFFRAAEIAGARQEGWFSASAASSEKNRFSLWQNIP